MHYIIYITSEMFIDELIKIYIRTLISRIESFLNYFCSIKDSVLKCPQGELPNIL